MMIMTAYNQTARATEEPPVWNHVAHCFNYLRLSLMCHADTTLEGKDADPTTQRVCKDYSDVSDWATAHRRYSNR